MEMDALVRRDNRIDVMCLWEKETDSRERQNNRTKKEEKEILVVKSADGEKSDQHAVSSRAMRAREVPW